MKKDLLSCLIAESNNYTSLEKIEQLVEGCQDLKNIPIWPLYYIFKNMSEDKVAQSMNLLSPEQRHIFWDIDLWHRDEIDPESFEFWPRVYSMIKDEDQVFEFVSSSAFTLYLKGKFNIWTFDVEDPLYPDHDNYFLTDDQLLLFEFDEGYYYVDEIRELIRFLYSKWGVERSYCFLFKLVSDSYLILSEEEYALKKGRLQDYGLVDYFDALEFITIFNNQNMIDSYIDKKTSNTPRIDDLSKNQILSEKSLLAFKNKSESKIFNELSKVKDEDRAEYLRFSFIRLLNGNYVLNTDLQSSFLELARQSQTTLLYLELGLSYIENKTSQEKLNEAIFDRFDFIEIFKVGYSLIKLELKKINQSLKDDIDKTKLEKFWGGLWQTYLDLSFASNPKVVTWILKKQDLKGQLINDYESYQSWIEQGVCFRSSLSFIKSFNEMFDEICRDQKVLDSYYSNYNLEDIDFEAILLSSFANSVLLNIDKSAETQKLGLSLEELKKVLKYFLGNQEEIQFLDRFDDEVDLFIKKYGFEKIKSFNKYIHAIFKNHLEGYDFEKLSDEDYRHIGGPIQFSTNHKKC